MTEPRAWFDRPLPEIVAGLRERRVRSRDLVAEALGRIRSRNPAVNAVVTFRDRDEALADADAADRRFDEGAPAGLLDGVPLTVKDIFDTAGIRTTFGVLHHRDRVPDRDAPIVARCRAGGAVVVAKTNTPEFGFSPECDNLIAGRTSNPFDPRRTSGGSSGGEAALLALGASVLGLGSDISGSLRTPAHFCGVASLKPTHGWISNAGHQPVLEPWQEELLAPGPMARRVEDLAVAWEALTGARAAQSAGKTRIGVAGRDDPGLDPRCRQALERAASALAAAGHRVEPIELPEIARAHDLWRRYLLADGGAALRRALEDSHPFFLPLELVKSALGRSRRSSMMLTALLVLGRARPMAPEEVAASRASLAADLEGHLGPDRAILLPVTPGVAHRHWSIAKSLSVFRYIRLANVLGLPAVVAPVVPGRSARELPAGVQLLGAAGSESTLIALGCQVEPGPCLS